MKHKSFLRHLKYAFCLVRVAAPRMIWWQSIIGILQTMESFFFNVLFIKFVVQLLEGQKSMASILLLAASAMWVKMVIAVLVTIFTNQIRPICSLNISYHVNRMLYEKALSLDLAQYEEKEFHDKYYKAISKASNVIESVVINSIQFMNNLVTAVMVVIYVVHIDPLLSLMMVLPVITTFALKAGNKIRYQLKMENLSLDREMDYVNRVAYLKDYAVEVRLTDIFSVLKERYCNASRKKEHNYKIYGGKLTFLRFISDYTLTNITIFFSYLYIGWRYMFRHDIQISDFSVLIAAVSNMVYRAGNLLNIVYAIQEGELYIQNICDYLDVEPGIPKNENGFVVDTAEDFQIEFEHVAFKYSANDRDVLVDINVSIRKGERIAIVGKNGSGKSTFIKLLLRLYDATEGEVRINGYNVKNVNLEAYRKLFCVVFQDYKLFAVSMEENMKMGEDRDTASLRQALKSVGMESFTPKLSAQLSKELSSDGIVFSGGQNQKIALARGFVSESNVIIFDEPTAALDPEAEHILFENIYRDLVDKTVLFVSHRLTSTIKADKIIMIENGRIVECGTHEQLMENKGDYYTLFNIQAASYYEEKK